MNRRLELQAKLEEVLGSDHVYYQPPETIKMEYPAIVYSTKSIDEKSANNKTYSFYRNYEIIVIDKKPDNPVIEEIVRWPLSYYTRHFATENLNHDVIELYY